MQRRKVISNLVIPGQVHYLPSIPDTPQNLSDFDECKNIKVGLLVNFVNSSNFPRSKVLSFLVKIY